MVTPTPAARSLGYRAPLLWILLPYLAGLALGKAGLVASSTPTLIVAGLAAVATWWARRRATALWGGLLVSTMIAAGSASYVLHRNRAAAWDILPPRETKLALRIDRLFAQSDVRRASGLATVENAPDHLPELAGQHLYFSLTLRAGEPPPIPGTAVAAIGVIETIPRNPPADTFAGYLAGAGMNFRLSRGRILAETRPPDRYRVFCAAAAARFKVILSTGIGEKRPELAALLRAMMLGETDELSSEQRTVFMRSGTMHLFAISGLNIGVIAVALAGLLALLRLPPWLTLLASAGLLWLFVDITGGSPSAVRAFVMAVFLQTAFVLRQPANVLAALVASACAVVLVAPMQVFGASFLMSYTIVLALLLLGLPLGEAWAGRWSPFRSLPKPTWRWFHHGADHAWRWLTAALAIGIATSLVSLVTGVQFFRLLTPGALVANLLLVPAAMLVTLGGFAALICGLAGLTAGAALCNHAAALVLLGIERSVQASVRIPGAFLPARFDAPWAGTLTLAALVAALLWGYGHGWKPNRGGWLPPFAVVALALWFGVSFG